MAKAVEFRRFTPEDSRADLIRRIEAAPHEHAEAILEAYELLQNLHKTGVIAAANGAFNAGETVIGKLTDVVSSKPAIAAMRLGLIFGDILTSLDANQVHEIVASTRKSPPSWFSIIRQLFRPETRQVMGLGLGLMQAVGDSMNASGTTKHE